jgi:MOSC domain-containing protein YiiM
VSSDSPSVAAVCAGKKHQFRKESLADILLVANRGVEGDAHNGVYVQHLYDRARDPARRNLRQVHFLEDELLDELRAGGFDLRPGQLGENITTKNIKLTELPAGAVLRIGSEAVVRITGLREPCIKIERFERKLQKAVTAWRDNQAFMKGAVMAVVVAGGRIRPGDGIEAAVPETAVKALQPV